MLSNNPSNFKKLIKILLKINTSINFKPFVPRLFLDYFKVNIEMRGHMSFLKKIPYIKVIPVFIIAVIIFKAINNIDQAQFIFNEFISIISYLLWGLSIAYFLNYLTEFFILKLRLKRMYSILFTYIIFFGIIIFVLSIIIPVLVTNITIIIENLPLYYSRTTEFITNNVDKNYTFLKDFGIVEILESNTDNIIEYIKTYLNVILIKAIDITSIMVKFIIGILISIYMLKDKEN